MGSHAGLLLRALCSVSCSVASANVDPSNCTLTDLFSCSSCLLSMVACSHPGHLPQHVQVLSLWLPNSVCFSASHTFLYFPLPSGKGLRLTGLKFQVPSSVLIQFPFSPLALSGFLLEMFPQCGSAYILVVPFFASYVCFGILNSTWKACAQV